MELDLRWWTEFLDNWKGVSLIHGRDTRLHHTFFGDASGVIAIGGFYLSPGSNLTSLPLDQCFWSRREHSTLEDIPVLELRAIELAVRFWGPRWSLSHLVIYTDNSVAFYGLSAKSSRSKAGMEVLRSILLMLAALDISFEVH